MAVFRPSKEVVKTASNAPMMCYGIPARATSPLEFFITMFQLIQPLGVRVGYIIQKSGNPPKLPAEARNLIMTEAIERECQYLLFLDDDVLFPDIMAYRLFNLIRLHPEAGVITGVYGTKIDPSEPLIYSDDGQGAYWDWALGDFIPIHSGGAGCMIVNMEYARKMTEPWFNDVSSQSDGTSGKVRETFGHDRYFMAKMREETGRGIYADTGLILAHFDVNNNRPFILPPEAPCYQRPAVGEAYFPFLHESGAVDWNRIIPTPSQKFKGYVQWLREQHGESESVVTQALLKEDENAVQSVSSDDRSEAVVGSRLDSTHESTLLTEAQEGREVSPPSGEVFGLYPVTAGGDCTPNHSLR